jgi:hypothetical protein
LDRPRHAVDGDTAHDVAVAVAKFTATGGGTVRNPKWMWVRLQKYRRMQIDTKPDKWEAGFRDQTSANINTAVNGIAKLLKVIAQQ